MKIYLVTGAAGFIGSHSVDMLLKQGYAVVGVDNLRTGNLQNLASARSSSNFLFVKEDVTNETALRSLFNDHDFAGVLHLAALVSVPESFEKPDLNYHINLAASDLLARLCVAHSCQRLVFASSAAVYGNTATLPTPESAQPHPLSPYAAAKLASEIMLLGYAESYSLPVVCFRYFNVYGPRQDPRSPYSGVLSIFTERFKAGVPVTVYGDGEQTRDFVSVQDVARANCHALTADNVTIGRYNVCTNKANSLNHTLNIFHDIYPAAPPAQYAEARIGDIRHSLGDANLLKSKLGISAQIPFDQGLRALITESVPLSVP